MKTRAEKQSLEIQAAAGRPKPEGVTTEKLIVMVHDELRASNPDLQDVVNALSFKYDMRVSSNDVARALRGEALEAGGPGSGPHKEGEAEDPHKASRDAYSKTNDASLKTTASKGNFEKQKAADASDAHQQAADAHKHASELFNKSGNHGAADIHREQSDMHKDMAGIYKRKSENAEK